MLLLFSPDSGACTPASAAAIADRTTVLASGKARCSRENSSFRHPPSPTSAPGHTALQGARALAAPSAGACAVLIASHARSRCAGSRKMRGCAGAACAFEGARNRLEGYIEHRHESTPSGGGPGTAHAANCEDVPLGQLLKHQLQARGAVRGGVMSQRAAGAHPCKLRTWAWVVGDASRRPQQAAHVGGVVPPLG
eukprot:363437-Chlamydomonas_euryale.AAC.1